ncbi:MAG: type II secretion system protein [Candidatus Ratteibacteria bacterium]|jgi:type II secretory pathway pseudopilin PulG
MNRIFPIRKKFLRRGITLIELLIVITISIFVFSSISIIMTQSIADIRANKDIIALQTDLDLAGLTIKGIIEEADSVTPSNTAISPTITARYQSLWETVFSASLSQGALLITNTKTGSTETVISTLKSINFNTTEARVVTVSLSVEKGSRTLNNSFAIFMRNSP